MYKTLATAAVALALASSAQALIVTTSTAGPDLIPAGLTVLENFEGSTAKLSSTSNFVIATGSVPGKYAAPFGDTTKYLVVPGSGTAGTALLTLAASYSVLSFYWGSIDSYNTVSFFDVNNNLLGSVTGSQVPGAADNGTTGADNSRRVTFAFTGTQANKIQFSTGAVAFEADDVAGAVPEPATWAMIIVGMGMVGIAARRRRSGSVTA